jgi:hypothetical protein
VSEIGKTGKGVNDEHFRRQEYSNIIGNVVLFAMALFVAFGRFVVIPL